MHIYLKLEKKTFEKPVRFHHQFNTLHVRHNINKKASPTKKKEKIKEG